jgi:hypothetical protein
MEKLWLLKYIPMKKYGSTLFLLSCSKAKFRNLLRDPARASLQLYAKGSYGKKKGNTITVCLVDAEWARQNTFTPTAHHDELTRRWLGESGGQQQSHEVMPGGDLRVRDNLSLADGSCCCLQRLVIPCLHLALLVPRWPVSLLLQRASNRLQPLPPGALRPHCPRVAKLPCPVLANGNVSIIYNPYDTYVNSSGAVMRNPFPGNIIPAS